MMKLRTLFPVLAVLGALLAAFLANLALPHRVVHGIEAFAAAWSVFLVTRLTARLASREREIARLNDDKQRAQRLTAITALAAGAAHELATPLGTIAVIAGDLARHERTADDASLLRAEVARCREILDRLAGRGDDALDAAVSPEALFDAIRARLPARMRDRVDLVVEGGAPAALALPLGSVASAVAGLVKNGVEASDADGRVKLCVGVDEVGTQIVVEDRGSGMPESLAARLGDPFLSTKEPGAGMGLGVYLARLVAERLGGPTLVESALGRGTRVMLDLPVSEVRA